MARVTLPHSSALPPRPTRVLVRVLPQRPVKGQSVELLAMFARDGQPHDPTACRVLFRHQGADGPVGIHPLEREAQGEYSTHLVAGEPGVWLWRVEDDERTAIEEGSIVVQASAFS